MVTWKWSLKFKMVKATYLYKVCPSWSDNRFCSHDSTSFSLSHNTKSHMNSIKRQLFDRSFYLMLLHTLRTTICTQSLYGKTFEQYTNRSRPSMKVAYLLNWDTAVFIKHTFPSLFTTPPSPSLTPYVPFFASILIFYSLHYGVQEGVHVWDFIYVFLWGP